MTRTCKYAPCSKEFEPTHPRHEFCEPTCRANQHYVEHPEKGRAVQSGALRSVATHPLDDARGQVEEGKTSADWALIAREHVMRTLLRTSYFTADDLDPLGIPEHYRRSVHGLVTAYFRGPQPYMEEAGRRKSERPERKGAKNTVFRITAKGRRELPKMLAGLGAGARAYSAKECTASVDSGESGSSGSASTNPEGTPARIGRTLDRPELESELLSTGAGQQVVDVDPGDKTAGASAGVPTSQDPGGPLATRHCTSTRSGGGSSECPCSEEPARLFDLDQAREKPRSAVTDPRAA